MNITRVELGIIITALDEAIAQVKANPSLGDLSKATVGDLHFGRLVDRDAYYEGASRLLRKLDLEVIRARPLILG